MIITKQFRNIEAAVEYANLERIDPISFIPCDTVRLGGIIMAYKDTGFVVEQKSVLLEASAFLDFARDFIPSEEEVVDNINALSIKLKKAIYG